MNIDLLKDISEEDYNSKSLQVTYKRFAMRYLIENADTFESNDWNNIAFMSNLSIPFIIRFKRKLNPTIILVNKNIPEQVKDFVKENSIDHGTLCCEIISHGEHMYRPLIPFYSWR